MKLYCLGQDPTASCMVLKLKGTMLMLDCGLELSAFLRFLPRVPRCGEAERSKKRKQSSKSRENEARSAVPLQTIGGNIFIEDSPLRVQLPQLELLDMSSVDAILISNARNMLALPFITEYTSFRGKVYATEPTVQIGRMLMKELVTYVEESTRIYSGSNHMSSKSTTIDKSGSRCWLNEDLVSSLPRILQEQLGNAATDWQKLYKLQDVESAVAKINALSYDQPIELFGCVQATALSSGFSLGSCNWLLQTSSNRRIAYVADSATASARHPQPMNVEKLAAKGCHTVILTKLTREPMRLPDPMLQELCSIIGQTLSGGGNVLLPCYPSGIVFDLFDFVYTYLQNVGIPRVPLYFLSPVGDSTLAYANIASEWLCKSKQDKAYLPEMPFIHAELLESGRLNHFSGVHAKTFASTMKEPCVVFAGHPSLRCGDAVYIFNMWAADRKNAVIFTEPDFDHVVVLQPYQPFEIRTHYCPLDPRLNFVDANRLLHTLQPKHIILPQEYFSSSTASAETSTEEMMSGDKRTQIVPPNSECKVSTFMHADVLHIPSEDMFERARLAPSLALNLHPSSSGISENIVMANVEAVLSLRDNKLLLEPLSSSSSSSSSSSTFDLLSSHQHQHRLWGRPALPQILFELSSRGIGSTPADIQVISGRYHRRTRKQEGTEEEEEEEEEEGEEGEPHRYSILLPNHSAAIHLSPMKTSIECESEELRMILRDIVLAQCKDFASSSSSSLVDGEEEEREKGDEGERMRIEKEEEREEEHRMERSKTEEAEEQKQRGRTTTREEEEEQQKRKKKKKRRSGAPAPPSFVGKKKGNNAKSKPRG
ncbi:Integrator complex subunit 9 [Balamuthia mandrillaris]